MTPEPPLALHDRAPGRFRRLLAPAGFLLALAALLLGVGAGLGSRWGWWHFRTGFTILADAAFCAIAAILVSLLALILARRGATPAQRILAIAGLVLGLAIAAVPLRQSLIAGSVPPIHDISTDTDNPPSFVAVLPFRAQAENSAAYGGPEVAALQHQGYPEIQPARFAAPPAKVFEAALATAREMGWHLVAASAAEGRIEARETSFWFGFTDDIVVRVTPADAGSRVDMRSASRVGRSDIGVNARRIDRYLAALKLKLAAS